MSRVQTFCSGLLGAAVLTGLFATPAVADDAEPTHDYVGLSFTGNGMAPSALEALQAQARAPRAVDVSVDATEKGDAGFGYTLPLPPAHLAPQVSLGYSSAMGAHSVLGRGWTLSTGLTIQRLTGKAARAYADTPGVHQIHGEGIDGLLVPHGAGWRYVSTTPGALTAEYEPATKSWRIDHGGVVRQLVPRDGALGSPSAEPVRWQVVHAEDRHGNEVDWTWTDGALTSVAYGGWSGNNKPHLFEVTFTYAEAPDYPRSYQEMGGQVDLIDHRLEAISVWSVGTHQYELVLDYQETGGDLLLAALDQYADGAWRNLYTFEYTLPDGTYQSVFDALPPFLSTSLTAPSWDNSDQNDNIAVQELRDLSGDGLIDVLDCVEVDCEAGWLRWSGPAEDKLPSWEDPGVASRSFARPYMDKGLERTVNVVIGQYYGSAMPINGDVGQVDSGDEYGSYTTRAVVDLNGDGFADLLIVPQPDLHEYSVSAPNPWDANLTEGVHTWHLYLGGPDGFAATPQVLQAPFRAIRISKAPRIPGGPVYPGPCHTVVGCEFSFQAESAVVDLMDLSGDGWLDVVYASPTGLRVWAFDPAGDWMSQPPITPSAPGMQVDSLASYRAHVAPEGRTSSLIAASSDYLDKPPTHTIHRMEGIKGFVDLNGDGFLDFIDTQGWQNTGAWDVWLGTLAGFTGPILWDAPLPYYSASHEGFPWVESCSFTLSGEGGRPILEQLPLFGGGAGLGEFEHIVQGGCSVQGGSYQDTEVMLLDVDGDGRVDLIHANDPTTATPGQWWRNAGDGFTQQAPNHLGITGRTDLMSALSVPTLARYRTDQQVIVNSSWDFGRSTSAQTAANYGVRAQRVMVGDFNGDGLLDSLHMPDGNYTDESRYSTGTRPGLLSSVIRGEGAQTTLEYLTSATVWPTGTVDVSEHLMGSHRDLVVRTDTSDPVTGFGYERRYTYEDGYCEEGVCWGFGWREVEHIRHKPADPTCTAQLGNTLLRTTTEYELSRDHVLPLHEQHEVDWSTDWMSDCSSTGPLHARFETAYKYSEVGPAPHSRWLIERKETEHPAPGNGGSKRDLRTTAAYDAVGNVTEVQRVAGPNHPDNITVETAYVSDGTGAYFLPKTQRTLGWNHENGGVSVVEEGRFAYDGGSHGAAFSTGDLTRQQVCSGSPSSPCNHLLTWNFDWHVRGLLAEAQGPAGFATYNVIPTLGGLLPKIERNALLHQSEYTYDRMGRVVAREDPNGVITRTEYDGFGRIVEETTQGAGGNDERVLATYLYHDDSVPRYVEITRVSYSSNGTILTTYPEYEVYDGLGRVVQRWRADELGAGYFVTDAISDLSGAQSYTTYPRAVSVFSPNFQSTQGDLIASLEWRDPFGDLVQSWEDYSESLGHLSVSYPVPGVVQTEDAAGRIHEARHDVHGRLVEVREGSGALTASDRTASYKYDGRDRIVRFTDGNLNEHTYEFDLAGRLGRVYRQGSTGPREPVYQYKYNGPYPTVMSGSDGNPLVEWEYDALGRTTLKRVLHPSNNWDTFTWTWDQGWIGARSETSDPRGSTTYTYAAGGPFGAFGWPTRVQRSYDDYAGDVSVWYTYDYAGRVIRTDWPGGQGVDTEFTPTGWLLQQSVRYQKNPYHTQVTYTYDDRGRPSGFIGEQLDGTAGTFTSQLAYTGAARPNSVGWYFNGGLLQSIGWEYYDTGQLYQKTVFPPTDAPFVYAYDDLGRIESIHLQGDLLEGFAYDLAGNPATGGYQWHDGSVSYPPPVRFHEIPERTTVHGDDEYFTWDHLSRLSSRMVVPGDPNEAPHTSHYEYDGAGRLLEVKRAGPGGRAWALLDYDVDDRVVREHRTDTDLNSQEIYRFEGWRFDAVNGEQIEAVLPMLKMVSVAAHDPTHLR